MGESWNPLEQILQEPLLPHTPSHSEASFVSHKPPASTARPWALPGPGRSGAKLPLSLRGCGGYWNDPLPTSPECETRQGQSDAGPGNASSAEPSQFQGLASLSAGSRDPCDPRVPTGGTSLTSTVPTSLHSLPSGKFAWKRHMRNKRGKSEEVSQTIPMGSSGNHRATGPDRSGAKQAGPGLALLSHLPTLLSQGADAASYPGQAERQPAGPQQPTIRCPGSHGLRVLTAHFHPLRATKRQDHRNHRHGVFVSLEAPVGRRAFLIPAILPWAGRRLWRRRQAELEEVGHVV